VKAVRVKGKGFSFVPVGAGTIVETSILVRVKGKGKGFSFVPVGAGTIVETSILEKMVFSWSFLWSSLPIPHEMSFRPDPPRRRREKTNQLQFGGRCEGSSR